MKLLKSQLIERVAAKADLTKKDVKSAIEALQAVIVEEVLADNKVEIFKFGAFEPVVCKERIGRNPFNGEPMTIESHRAIKFRPSAGLKALFK